MTKRRCQCDVCGVSWNIASADGEDVWTVVQRILDMHRRLSSDCAGGRDTIRVTTPRALRGDVAR